MIRICKQRDMKILKEVSLDLDFKITFPEDHLLMRTLVDAGLIPDRVFKVLFKLTGGVMVIGDRTLKVALDEITAGRIVVNLV